MFVYTHYIIHYIALHAIFTCNMRSNYKYFILPSNKKSSHFNNTEMYSIYCHCSIYLQFIVVDMC